MTRRCSQSEEYKKKKEDKLYLVFNSSFKMCKVLYTSFPFKQFLSRNCITNRHYSFKKFRVRWRVNGTSYVGSACTWKS